MGSFYKEHIYPALVDKLGDPPPIRDVRRQIIPLAEGDVLEIGVGPGANFVHYDLSRVTRLYALEPNRGMIRRAEQKNRTANLPLQYLNLPGERIPLEDASVDTVVSTFTFCTIPDIVKALRGIARVLRPSGKLIFFEHGLSTDAKVRRWQRISEPIPYCLFEGCHITRDIPALIKQSGFSIESMKAAYLAEFPKSMTYCWWGTAVIGNT